MLNFGVFDRKLRKIELNIFHHTPAQVFNLKCCQRIFASWLVTILIVAETSANDDFILPWESRPYQVQVWTCSDDSPEIAAVLPAVNRQIIRRAELLDPSGWNLKIAPAPTQLQVPLLEAIEDKEKLASLIATDITEPFDKLIVIGLVRRHGAIQYRVREYDTQTGQWGAMFERSCAQSRDLASGLIAAIQRVFMPLARIDRVTDQGQVFIRARAVNSCQQSDVFELNSPPTPIENSPAWIRPQDRFLPVIRKVDRNGDLAELEPIPFTYLTVESPVGSRMECKLHSRQRAVLGGRSSKRAQKLALVIRPPESSTQLKLVSRDSDQRPLSGYEIFSRPPGATKEDKSEFLGLTDWRGMIEIPPTQEGLRLVYVKRGSRPLMKLPIIPGLYDELETPVPDDEARLNAEGIANGFQIEILNLVAQRELFQSQIKAALDKSQIVQARELLEQFQKLESGQNLKIRLADEETRLRNSTLNQRETDRIVKMFRQLNGLVSKTIRASLESELQGMIQKAK